MSVERTCCVGCIPASYLIKGSVTLRSICFRGQGECRHYRRVDDDTEYIVTSCAVALLSYLLHVYTQGKSSISPDIHRYLDFEFNTDMASPTVPQGTSSAVGLHMGEVQTHTFH